MSDAIDVVFSAARRLASYCERGNTICFDSESDEADAAIYRSAISDAANEIAQSKCDYRSLEAEIERLTKALTEANAKLGNLSDTFRRLPPITQELAEDYAAFGAVASKIMHDSLDAAINDEVDSIDKELGQ